MGYAFADKYIDTKHFNKEFANIVLSYALTPFTVGFFRRRIWRPNHSGDDHTPQGSHFEAA